MEMTNPYFYGGMIVTPNRFFGRERELKYIRDRLRKKSSTAIVGIRRIGKSSLLFRMTQQLESLPSGTLTAFLDMQEPALQRPMGMLTAAWRKWWPEDTQPITSCEDFVARVKRINDLGYFPVLCLDEVEALSENREFDDDFFDCLRSLGSQGKLAYVTASCDPLDIIVKQSGRTSRFYNIFTHVSLGGLESSAVDDLLTRPFEEVGLTPPTIEVVDFVRHMSGSHPFYLQMAGYHVYDQLCQGGAIDYNELRLAFAVEAKPHFLSVWRNLEREQRNTLRRLQGLESPVLEFRETLADLVQRGIVEQREAGPEVFSSVLAGLIQTGWLDRTIAQHDESDIHALEEARPRDDSQHESVSSKDPEAKADPRVSVLTYTVVAVLLLSASLAVTLLLAPDRLWVFLPILVITLSFVLVLDRKLTGGQFLDLLLRFLNRWS